MIKLYNTRTRRKEIFEPADPKQVTMYVCGPTVYDFAHIGNARAAVVFDVLFRILRQVYGPDHVKYVRNITDVDDKINQRFLDTGTPIAEIAATYKKAYQEDMAALGCLPPTVEPHATDHILQMIAMIEALIARGHAYEAEGHVLFAVASDPHYGSLSGLEKDNIIAGARVEVAPYKKDPSDFVLWKPSPPELPGWESPWGRGRPGWHIECSAMAKEHLGPVIDIHGGGQDLIFPHHENERAQSCCANDTEIFARTWVHNGFLQVEGQKMSKSLGNFFTVRQLRDEGLPGEVMRLVLLSAHYRQPLDWTQDKVAQARAILDRIYEVLKNTKHIQVHSAEISPGFLKCLTDDLNTPEALALLQADISELNKTGNPVVKGHLLGALDMLALGQMDPAEWFQGGARDAEIDALIEARLEARRRKDFKEADRIREELAARGILLEDSAQGTTWKRA